MAPPSAPGLIDENTGMPMRSRPVMSATLVIPAALHSGSTRRSVSSAATDLCPSSAFVFGLDVKSMEHRSPHPFRMD